jgi:hypothetical protein
MSESIESDGQFLSAYPPWLSSSYPHGQGKNFIEHMVQLSPQRVLIIDQTNDLRKAAGLPVALHTPIRDVLVAHEIETHVFVSGTSFRFEKDDTVKRW